jgi:hypothetical protein
MLESGSAPARERSARCRCGVHAAFAIATYCALWLVVPAGVGAQDVQRFTPALSDQGFLGLDGTRTPGSLRGSVSLFSDLALHPVELPSPQGTLTPVENRLMLHRSGELGLGGRAAIGVHLPLIAYQDSPYRTPNAQVFTLADPQLSARYRVLGTSMSDKDEPHDGPGLALQAGLGLPLGKRAPVTQEALPLAVAQRAFASDGFPRLDVALLGDFQLLGAGIGGSLGYRHHFWDPHGVTASATSAADEFTFAAALKLPIPPLPALGVVLELRGVTGFRSARDTSLELDLGARLTLGNFIIVVGGGLGLTQGIGTPDARILLGLYAVPPKHDQDDDGIDDDADKCPFLAEDRDGFQDDDGCPDPDNDNDLVPDLDDKCPNESAEEGHDDDEDGCTDKAPSAAAAPSQAAP